MHKSVAMERYFDTKIPAWLAGEASFLVVTKNWYEEEEGGGQSESQWELAEEGGSHQVVNINIIMVTPLY